MGLIRLGKMGQALNGLRRRFLFGARHSTESYVRLMNSRGARISEDLQMSQPETVYLDDRSPYMLEIGKQVWIAAHVTILTHDACWLVPKAMDGKICGHVAPVKIGNNVFIGMWSTICCNVSICDNVIIGAGSLVTKSLRKPGVYAGNPAKWVASCETYMAIRGSCQLREAYKIAECYYTRFKVKPPQEISNEYFWLFAPRDLKKLPEEFIAQMMHCGNYEETAAAFMISEPDFDGYDEFWEWCMERMERKK